MTPSLTPREKHPELFTPSPTTPPRTRTRTIPMEVLNLSFPRTGTASMQLALNILHIPCYHGLLLFSAVGDCELWSAALDAKFFGQGAPFTRVEWDQLLGQHGAVGDVPAVAFAEELVGAYPEAKVVLVEREVEGWFTSFDNAVLGAAFSPVVGWLAEVDRGYLGLLLGMTRRWIRGWLKANSRKEAREKARGAYREHYELVRRVTPKDRLLNYQLGSGWEPLCAFLGRPIPDVEFPRVNETAMLQEKFWLLYLRGGLLKLTANGHWGGSWEEGGPAGEMMERKRN